MLEEFNHEIELVFQRKEMEHEDVLSEADKEF
jgi:hypothetical protein